MQHSRSFSEVDRPALFRADLSTVHEDEATLVEDGSPTARSRQRTQWRTPCNPLLLRKKSFLQAQETGHCHTGPFLGLYVGELWRITWLLRKKISLQTQEPGYRHTGPSGGLDKNRVSQLTLTILIVHPRLVVVDDTNPNIQYSGPWFSVQNTQSNTGDFGPPFENTLHGVNVSAIFSFLFFQWYVTDSCLGLKPFTLW